jgi:tricorn protease
MLIEALLLALLAEPASLVVAQDETRASLSPSAVMLRYPDVSQDRIAFRYAGDLWLVPREGGIASRLTSAAGGEAFPSFSPDGSRIAFIASYDGGSDLYVMPTEGGIPERVTFHPGQEILCDWTPDGERLLYWSTEASGMARAPRMMTVDVDGGQPEALPPAYGVFGSIDATGEWLAYTPSGREFRTWKRYQGGLAQDVWLYNLLTGTSRRVTDFPGTDAQPMWHGRTLLFVSDRGPDGVLNLFSYDLDTEATRQLTQFTEFGVRFASVGPRDVVFENGGRLYRYDLTENALVAVDVVIPGDRPNLRPERLRLAEDVASASPGPTGARVVIEARGELFDAPAEDGFTRALTRSSGVAERSPVWSPDGAWIAFFSDRTGEYELTVKRADGADFEGANEFKERTLSDLGAGFRSNISWAPDAQKLVFTDNAGRLWLATCEEWGSADVSIATIAVDPAGYPLSASWSPGSDWLTYSHKHQVTRNGAVFLHELATGTTTCVTSGTFDDSSPAFGANGDFLYYASSRHFSGALYADQDSTWIYAGTQVLIAVPLRADVDGPLVPTNDEEPIESDEGESDEGESDEGESDEGESDESDTDDGTAGGSTGDEAPVEGGAAAEGSDDEGADSGIGDSGTGETDGGATADDSDDDEAEEALEIEVDGFEARGIQIPIDPGRIRSLVGTSKGLLFVRSTPRGVPGPPRLVLLDTDEWEEATVIERLSGFDVCARADKVLVTRGNSIAIVDLAPGQSFDETVDLGGLVAQVDPRAEWEQMLIDTWRLFRDFFYQEDMHGLDWPAVRERYLAALFDATSREDLAFLTGEMMAELNVGHAYNGRVAPSGPAAPDGPTAGLLGADFERVGEHLAVARLLAGGSYDTDARGPLAHTQVEVGDVLLAVDGVAVDADRSVSEALLGTAGRTTQLTFASDPGDIDGSRYDVLVEPLGSDGSLRYRDWVRRNRERVFELSGGRIGYVHVPDTGADGQNELVRQMQGAIHAPALLVDERWNGGGQIPTRFIELLDRPLVNRWAVRHGEDWDWPPDGHFGPKAMLINGWAGSGGDAFPYYFRQAGLGKLIGRRTWGGLVGLSGNPALIDGTSHSIPTFGFYELDGTWGIEGHGVDPDIEVMDDPSALARGEDPQLEAAVAHLLSELERAPFVPPSRPKGPDRAGSGVTDEDR